MCLPFVKRDGGVLGRQGIFLEFFMGVIIFGHWENTQRLEIELPDCNPLTLPSPPPAGERIKVRGLLTSKQICVG
jgi:hypothetical protein